MYDNSSAAGDESYRSADAGQPPRPAGGGGRSSDSDEAMSGDEISSRDESSPAEQVWKCSYWSIVSISKILKQVLLGAIGA